MKFGVVALVMSRDTGALPDGVRLAFAEEDNDTQYFIGTDVSLEASSVGMMDQGGAILKETKVLSYPAVLITFVRGLSNQVSCTGMETGALSHWLFKQLTEAGLTTVLMETRQVEGALKAIPIKKDRRDARGIAQLLRMGGCSWCTANRSRRKISGLFWRYARRCTGVP